MEALTIGSQVSYFLFIVDCLFYALSSFKLTDNVLQLQEVGDFEEQNCLPPQNLI